MFKRTERTKCGNCVYWEEVPLRGACGICFRYPVSCSDLRSEESWCGEFVDREPACGEPQSPKPEACCGRKPDEWVQLTKEGKAWHRLECPVCGRVSVADTQDEVFEAWRTSATKPGAKPADHIPDARKKVEPQPAGEPSPEWLRKMADAEDAAGCVSVGGMAADLGMVKQAVCKGCGQRLKPENAWMQDGCPCNSPRGINQPAGELREWWVVASLADEATVDLAWRIKNKSGVHVREVPSPERVREALDEYAENKLCLNWDSHEQMYPSNSEYVLQLLRSLGVPTEGV